MRQSRPRELKLVAEEWLDFIINYDIKYPHSHGYGGQAAGATSLTRRTDDRRPNQMRVMSDRFIRRRPGVRAVNGASARREYRTCMENAVAQAFAANGRKLFFYLRYDLEDAENRMEIDFLIRRGNALSPVDVKSLQGKARSFLVKNPDKAQRQIASIGLSMTDM